VRRGERLAAMVVVPTGGLNGEDLVLPRLALPLAGVRKGESASMVLVPAARVNREEDLRLPVLCFARLPLVGEDMAVSPGKLNGEKDLVLPVLCSAGISLAGDGMVVG
jgi:hypothetical protein